MNSVSNWHEHKGINSELIQVYFEHYFYCIPPSVEFFSTENLLVVWNYFVYIVELNKCANVSFWRNGVLMVGEWRKNGNGEGEISCIGLELEESKWAHDFIKIQDFQILTFAWSALHSLGTTPIKCSPYILNMINWMYSPL